MKSRFSRIIGLILYFCVMGRLMDFNWKQLIQPKPLITVIAGMFILTLSQYKKRVKIEELLAYAKLNVLFSGFLTSLLSILSYVTPANLSIVNSVDLIWHLLPLLYGSIIFLVINLIIIPERKTETVSEEERIGTIPTILYTEQFFRNCGLTNRECHVAIKLLDNISNKEIASQLFISESTVKKHIQNIYQKLQINDRNGFRSILQEQVFPKNEKE